MGEIMGAVHRLTGQSFDDADPSGMSLSEDPRRQVLQRRICRRAAQQWQAWWEANWRKFTDDAAYQKVNLNVADEPLPPAPEALGKTARLSGEWTGAVLSPATQEGQYAWHTYDLDTGSGPNWPARIPRDDPTRDPKQLAEWASQSGVDLICVTYRSPDGTETYVLRALGMKVREINSRDLRNLDRLHRGRHPSRRPAGRRLADALRRHIAAIRAGCECCVPVRHSRRKYGSDRNDRSRHPHCRPHRNSLQPIARRWLLQRSSIQSDSDHSLRSGSIPCWGG